MKGHKLHRWTQTIYPIYRKDRRIFLPRIPISKLGVRWSFQVQTCRRAKLCVSFATCHTGGTAVTHASCQVNSAVSHLGCISISKRRLCKDVFGSSQPMRRLHFKDVFRVYWNAAQGPPHTHMFSSMDLERRPISYPYIFTLMLIKLSIMKGFYFYHYMVLMFKKRSYNHPFSIIGILNHSTLCHLQTFNCMDGGYWLMFFITLSIVSVMFLCRH